MEWGMGNFGGCFFDLIKQNVPFYSKLIFENENNLLFVKYLVQCNLIKIFPFIVFRQNNDKIF